MEFAGQPDAGELPIAPNCARGNLEHLYNLLFGESAEVTKLHDSCLARGDIREGSKGVIECDY
jgi:hypothetical protein